MRRPLADFFYSLVRGHMSHDGNRLMPAEWVASLLWVAFWGVLAYLAIFERSLSLASRLGVSHAEGTTAVVLGFLLLGAALFGFVWLLRFHPLRRLLRLLLLVAWLLSMLLYSLFSVQ